MLTFTQQMASDNPSGDSTNARRSLDFRTPETQDSTATQTSGLSTPGAAAPHIPVVTPSIQTLPTQSPAVGAPHTAVPTGAQTNVPRATIPTGAPTASATTPTSATDMTALQAQLLMLNQRIQTMSAQMTATPTRLVPQQQYQSREYWQRPIRNTNYPGEDAGYSSKRAYQQRLDAYLRKSSFIWRLITKEDPCPITTNANAMTLLVSALGTSWTFDNSDISGAMRILQQDRTVYEEVQNQMDAGHDSWVGSWRQRNSALYSTVCDTLDLSDDGNDLDILDVVEDGNGLAIYNLVKSRLKQIQTSDPMARAIQMKMGIDHIVYTAKPRYET